MPTISQLPLATDVADTDALPVSQDGVTRSVPVGTLLAGTQAQLTLQRGALLGRVSNGPGGPESVALGAGLQIVNDVLAVDNSSFPQTGTLSDQYQLLLNNAVGAPTLMPISLLRGLYTAGQNVTIDPDGTIQYTPNIASGSAIGAVAVGTGLVINASGQLSANIGAVPGTVAGGNDARIVNAEQITNKDVPGGYAGLDTTGLVPVSLLPPGGGSLNGANASTADATPAFTPAVPRSLAAHFSDVLNINDFGLARNGSTDDSAKFVAACQTAMANNLKLYIPAGGPILLTDAAQQNLSNICIFGDGIRDYDSPSGYGHVGSSLWFTGTTKSPFLLGPSVQFQGINFFWPNQTEAATTSNGNLPIAYPPLFTQQSPAVNITYFQFHDCQVTNCFDFFAATNTAAVVGGCAVERCIIYAIRNCFTLQFVPEVFFVANSLFTWGVYGSVVSVGPTFNLRTYTNTAGCWLKVTGNGTTSALSSTTVGGIMSCNNYVFGVARGVWLSGGTLDISAFINTSFDNVPTVLQGDPGCGLFSTRFTGGAWYPQYFSQAGNPEATAILVNTPAPGDVGFNCTFSGITIPFINGSLGSIAGSNISALTFSDIRCTNFGHTGGAGPYYGLQLSIPNANLRVTQCDFAPSNAALSNTALQILACASALVTGCTFRNCSAPIDIETTTGQITLSGNTTIATQGASPIIGVATTNLHDLLNNWDKPNFTYNGLAPNNFRNGATIGLQPVASTAASGYVGLQPSALGSAGGTRLGLTALGSSPVSLLTNAFNEEQLRINRQTGAVNYVAVRGSLSGSPTLVTTNGADANGTIQITGQGGGPVYLGVAGSAGSAVVHLGATADQSYIGVAPANGFSLSVPANCSTVLLKPAATLATGTAILPPALQDGEKIELWTSQTITALTVSGSGGALVFNGANFTLPANTSVGFFWNAANNAWFQRLGSGSSNGTIAQQNANNVTITGGSITGLSALGVGSNASVSASVVLNTAPGFARQVVYESAGLPRWVAGAEGNAENTVVTATTADAPSGSTSLPLASTAGVSAGMLVNAIGVATGTTVTAFGASAITLSQPTTALTPSGSTVTLYTNQGSDYAILPYDDLGTPLAGTLGQPLVITRATGAVTIKTLAVIGGATAPTPANGDATTNVATTAFVANTLATRIGAANGIAGLDATGHVPTSQLPASVQGALDYQGAWNATTNTPALASGTGTKGFYYTVATAGTTTLDGLSQWNVGDHAAYNGTAWEKFDGIASEVVTVAGRTGAVTLAVADVTGAAPLASPSLTGAPTAPTATAGTNTTQLATTAFVTTAVAAVPSAPVASVFGRTGAIAAASGDYTVAQITGAAPLASPALTGAPTAPTATALTNTTQLATTAYTDAAVAVEATNRAGAITALALGNMSTQNKNAVAITGGTIAGITSLAIGANTGGVVTPTLNAAAGNARQIVYQTAGNSRWNLMVQGDAELASVATTANGATTASTTLVVTSATGIVAGMSLSATGVAAGTLVTAVAGATLTLSAAATVANLAALTFYPNAGSSFSLRAYDDGGNLLFAPLGVGRAMNGALTLGTLYYGPIVAYGSGSSVAGNARGPGAVDLQQYRAAATNVASGQAAALFGAFGTAAGYAAFVAGNAAYDRGRYASFAYAAGSAATTGDTQTAFGVLRAASTVAAAARLTADGGGAGAANVWNIPNNTVFLVRLELMGWSATGVLAVSYLARFRLKRGATAGSTAVSNATLAADADNDTITGLTAPTIAADTTNGGLTLTSGFATSAAMRWAARVISVVELQ